MDNYENFVKGRVMPVPQAMEVRSGQFDIADGCKVVLRSNTDESATVVDVFAASWNARPQVSFEKVELPIVADGYGLTVAEDACTIGASSKSGVLNALNAMRQLVESERGVMTSSKWHVPCVEINDFPSLAFRGMHICWFPETPAWEIEKLIRLAAYFRYNYIVLESWGVVKLESHPEFCWDEFAVRKDEIRRLVRLCRSLGVTLCPQVNIFGHATASRVNSSKHVLLDAHPEYAPLFEADGWTWCISNPFTRKYLSDIVLEFQELFGNPPFFHIGCDEAYNAGNCSLCHNDYPRRFREHVAYFHDLLAERGSRTMMWHDMLLERGDERWKGYTAYGNPSVSQGLLASLPKDIVVCDWQYHYNEIDGKEPQWPTMKTFKQAGYDVLACPWMDCKGIASIGRCAAENGFFGLLETTWHLMQGLRGYYPAFACASNAAWNPLANIPKDVNNGQLTCHAVRRICRDMGLKDYVQLGSTQYQVPIHPDAGI